MPSRTRPEYDIDDAGNITETTATQDRAEANTDVNDFKYLLGTIHQDDDDLELYKTADVLDEVFDDDDGPLIVAYRRRIKP